MERLGEHPKRVLVDLDGVIFDFNRRVAEIVRQEFPHITVPRTLNQFFYFEDNFPEHVRPTIREITARRGFFASFKLIEGALSGWQRIFDAGLQPTVCSSPLKNNPTCREEKISAVERHFGRQAADQAIITRDKHLCDGIILIDDRGKLHGVNQAAWVHGVFDYPHNRDTQSDYRIRGWNDPKLEDTLLRAQEHYLRRFGGAAVGLS